MGMSVEGFIAKWSASGAAERANKDSFLIDLSRALDVPEPDPVTGDPARDLFVFEADARLAHEGGKVSVGKIDLYKRGCFILEAKQGSDDGSKKVGTAKRGTPMWNLAMQEAQGQALGYAKTFDAPPPFLITCDIGYCFDLYATFDGTTNYRPFPTAQANRIYLRDMAAHVETLRKVYLEPRTLDPSTIAAKVTRRVAGHLADLAGSLEDDGHPPELVAKFLMRCLFTMFAEDIGLLRARLFTDSIEKEWLPNPASFPVLVEALWKTMNDGGVLFGVGKLLRFNGGLFENPTALPLRKEHLERLLEAAKCNWTDVEPAIFGTLLERALNPRERHALGAHYTPRAYVERLVRPTIEEPLRAEWDLVRAEVHTLVNGDKVEQAKKAVRAFHARLCTTRVLDPACGSGNFLYVTLDLFKRLESEVLKLLDDLGDKQAMLDMHHVVTVSPAQFLGIEVKPWAREIADLVLWIGYLQWHYRTRGKVAPPEPVLRNYGNIECRDAVLAWDGEPELVRDDQGRPVTRWDGVTKKVSPVTGKMVPNGDATVPVLRFKNPRRSEWPDAEFIVGNPPYIGNKRMRYALGDEYVAELRKAWHDEVPNSAELVMYWWNHAATLVASGRAKRFGFITTNSIAQTFNRKVVKGHLNAGIALSFAIKNHPWVDTADGAAVRVAMTVGRVAGADPQGKILTVIAERPSREESPAVEFESTYGLINPDLTIGLDITVVKHLASNRNLGFRGITLVGDGFILPDGHALLAEKPIRRLVGAYALQGKRPPRMVIDVSGIEKEDTLRDRFPSIWQHLYDTQFELRRNDKRPSYRQLWWVFGEPRTELRKAVAGLSRFVATTETARRRFFVFLKSDSLPEQTVIAVASADAFVLGVLSSRVHLEWADRASRLGKGDDPRYTIEHCFDPFPFPDCTDSARVRIRALGESLDAHHKSQMDAHPDLTITDEYSVLDMLRDGEALSEAERVVHEYGLVSVLRRIHDDLDAAVLDAYGWPHDLANEQILERLVALNAERAAEEARGTVRWLRPEFQNPTGKRAATQVAMAADSDIEDTATTAEKAWPKKLPEQIGTVRDLVVQGAATWTVEQVAGAFKGAKRKEVESVLDSLAALGLLVGYSANGVRQWQAAARSHV